jgi:NAD(P)-dependent dehydrogenase (short-subunit alcohol dehydrogenase family)
LKDARVVVIGGTSGIGFAVAQRVLAEGAQVVVGSSNAEKVDNAVSRLGDGASGHTIDVRDEANVAVFFKAAGPFKHLVYTAGDWGALRKGGAIADLDLSGANDIFAVRFWGALASIKHAQGYISIDGSIALTDGAVAHRPRKGAPVNTAMAGAVEHLTRSLAVDLAPLRVNAVCPGYVLTEVWDSIPEDERQQQIHTLTQRQPLSRAANPSEVAEAYLYLMRGTFTTGQVLTVDGGMTLI